VKLPVSLHQELANANEFYRLQNMKGKLNAKNILSIFNEIETATI
jgi:hypothetical protein